MKGRFLIFVPELFGQTFVLFYTQGPDDRSFSVRDYLAENPPNVRYAKDFDPSLTASVIAELAERPGNHIFKAQRKATDDVEYWRDQIRQLNARHLRSSSLNSTFEPPRIVPEPPSHLETAQTRVMSLAELIAGGESEVVEFKQVARGDQSTRKGHGPEHAVVKSVAAFMNRGGGTLLIGVDDQGRATGLDHDLERVPRHDLDGMQNWLVNRIASSIGEAAASNIAVDFPSFDGVTICRVTVGTSGDPVYVKVNGEDRFYVRIGNTTRPFSTREAIAYIRQRWGGS